MGLLKRIDIDSNNRALVIELRDYMDFVSTIPSEAKHIKFIVIKNVDRDLWIDNYFEFYRSILNKLSLDSRESLLLLTSVPIEEYTHRVVNEPYETHIVMTVGLEPPACIEMDEIFKPLSVGTINIIVATEAPLVREAMIDLLRVIAEAKTLAIADLLLRCKSRASGTVTDAIVVARPSSYRGKLLFAGLATDIGNAIARSIYNELLLRGKEKLGIDGMLNNFIGLNKEGLVEKILEVYKMAPLPQVDLDIVRDRVRKLVEAVLRDPNVWSLLIAARELDIRGRMGAIPFLSVEEYREDSIKILADEVLGIALSLYIAGLKGLFSMYWIERLKKSKAIDIEKDNVFEDDIVSALIGSVLTLMYESFSYG